MSGSNWNGITVAGIPGQSTVPGYVAGNVIATAVNTWQAMGIPANVIAFGIAMMNTESGYNLSAQAPPPSTALGLGQFLTGSLSDALALYNKTYEDDLTAADYQSSAEAQIEVIGGSLQSAWNRALTLQAQNPGLASVSTADVAYGVWHQGLYASGTNVQNFLNSPTFTSNISATFNGTLAAVPGAIGGTNVSDQLIDDAIVTQIQQSGQLAYSDANAYYQQQLQQVESSQGLSAENARTYLAGQYGVSTTSPAAGVATISDSFDLTTSAGIESAANALTELEIPISSTQTASSGQGDSDSDADATAALNAANRQSVLNQWSALLGNITGPLSISIDGTTQNVTVTGSNGALTVDLDGMASLKGATSNGIYSVTTYSSTGQQLQATSFSSGGGITNQSTYNSDGSRTYTSYSIGSDGNQQAVAVSTDPSGNITSVSTTVDGQIATTVNTFDGNGILVGSTTVGIAGTSITSYNDPNDPNASTTTSYNTAGTEISVSTTTSNGDGTYTRSLTDSNGNPLAPPTVIQPSTPGSYLEAESGTVDILQAITELKAGNPAGAAIDGLKLAQTLSGSTSLGAAVDAAGGVEGLVGLIQGIHNGNVIGAIQSGVTVAGDGASLLNALGENSSFYSFMDTGNNAISQGVSSYLNSVSDGLGDGAASVPGLSFVNLGFDVAKGDYVDAAIDAIAIVNPALGAALEIADLLYNLLTSSNNYIVVPPDAGTSTIALGSDIQDTVSLSLTYEGARSTTVDLGTGNNLIQGGGGALQLDISSSAGRDTLGSQPVSYPYQRTYSVLFANDVAPTDVTLERSGNDMLFHIGSEGAELTVTNWFLDPSNQLSSETFADGTVWDAATLASLPVYQLGGIADATFNADAGYGNMIVTGNGNDIANVAYGATADIVGGSGESVFNIGVEAGTAIEAQAAANVATASGDDTINVGPYVVSFSADLGTGNNQLNLAVDGLIHATQEIRLGTGNNLINDNYNGTTYDVSSALGRDTISLTGSFGSVIPKTLSFDNSVTPAELSFERVGNDMLISVLGQSGSITVSNWFTNDLLRIQNFQFSDGTSFTADDLHNVLIPYHGDGDLIGSVGDDDIYAGNGNDLLVTNGGNDQLHGGSGNDTFTVSLESSAVVYTGDGQDSISVGEDATATIYLGAGNDTVAIDFEAASTTIFGGTGSAVINLGGVDDGEEANNVNVTAGSGSETIVGFAGTATLSYGVGDGNVEFANEASTATNTLKLGVGITQSDVTVQRSGNAVIFDVAGAGQITVDNWFASGTHAFDSIQFADGTSWTDANVDNALAAANGRRVQGNEMLGTTGNDVLMNFVSGEMLDGLGGTDIDEGGSAGGGDTFVFNEGYGSLEIEEIFVPGTSRPNVLALGVGITTSNLHVAAGENGSALVLTDGISGDQITLDNALSSATNSGVQLVEFADGTTWSSAQLIGMETTGTAGADLIYGSNEADRIDGRGDNDVEYGQGGSDTFVFNAGYGHLEISESFSGSDQPVLQLGVGIDASQVTLTYDSSSDLILTDAVSGDRIQIDGMNSSTQQGIQQLQFADGRSWSRAQMLTMASQFVGASGADTLTGSAGADTFDGEGGNDIEIGNGGNDTFIFNSGYGQLEIKEVDFTAAPENVLKLGVGITVSQVILAFDSSGNLILTDGVSGDRIQIDGMGSAPYEGIQQLQFADGTSLSRAQMLAMASEITGTTGADTLTGSSGADTFDGKGGNDVETGNGGNDTFIFDPGYGHLEISELDFSAAPHNVLQLGAGIAESALAVSSNGTNLVLTDGISGDQITLDNALSGSYYGVQQVQFADGTVWTEQQLIQMETTGTTGNDSLYGSSGANLFDGKGGNDYESGGGGGDTFVFNAGYGHLEVSELDFSSAPHNVLQLGAGITEASLVVTASSNGTSLVLTDGISGDQVTLDNALSGSYYGVQQVQFADGTVWTEQQLIQMETTGTTGNDSLYGNSGANLFDGKGGNDYESGGGGGDTFVFNAGYGHLEISELDFSSAPNNVLQLGAGITESSLVVTASSNGTSLVLTDGISGDQVTLDNALSGSYYGVQQVQFADGTVWTEQQLIQMETTGTTGNDSLYGNSGANLFDGKGGNDYESGDGGGDTFVFNAGYGHLEISELDFSSAPHNVLQLGAGITESSLSVSKSSNGSSLVVNDGIAGDQITLDNALNGSYYGVQQVQFSDGTSLSVQQLLAMATPITGTTGADTLTGTALGDIFDGKGGTDTEIGGGGDDTYLLEPSYGALTIENGVASTNVANGTLSILNESPDDIWLKQVGNDLQVDVMGTSTEATIQGWFANSYSQLNSITTTDSTGAKSMLDGQLSQLIQAMASYSAQNPGFDPASTANVSITDPALLALVNSSYHH